MPRIILFILATILLTSSSAGAQVTTNVLDGYWWLQAERADKVATVAAMVYAIPDGYSVGAKKALPFLDPHKLGKAFAALSAGTPKYEKPFNAYIDLIDAVETRTELRHVLISSIMTCVADGINTDDCLQHGYK